MISRIITSSIKMQNLRQIASFNLVQKRMYFHSSVDQSEMKHFSAIKDWWKSGSEMAPLYQYNFARVNFIREFMKDFNSKNFNIKHPLKDLQIIDIGCGGGLLSESLCRLGGKVTGLDANENSVQIANNHKELDQTLADNLEYKLGTAEQLSEQGKKYDIVTCMEVIEHVSDKNQFISTISQLVRPGGMIFLSTMEKSRESYMKLIVGAEYVANLVPKGTHDWNKFINPEDLSAILEDLGFKVVKIQGYNYNILTNEMELSQKKMNYVLSAIKIR